MAAASDLSLRLSLRQVRHLARDVFYERGEDYFANGLVQSLVQHGNTVTAVVSGTHDYTVRLSAEDGHLVHRCSCPLGLDGAFCKHTVATCLAWLDAGKNDTRQSSGKRAVRSTASVELVTIDDLRPWLLQQPASVLADFLLETAVRDTRLREKLLRLAARATARGLDLSVYRKAIDRATRTRGFIDYHEASGFAENVREAVAPLQEILDEDPSQAAVVMDLAEHTLTRVENVLAEADDSDGEIGSVLDELQDFHLAACNIARPDPEALAARLFAWETHDGWGVFHNAAEIYADVLGAAGHAAYRRLAEAAWAKLPAHKPGDHEGCKGSRYLITGIMESLARASGDIDALVAIKAKNLSYAWDYLQIAEIYREASRTDDALDWAERGLRAFPRDTDSRLLAFLADEYHCRRRHDDALALVWRPFESHPTLENYQLLKRHAKRAAAWPDWRGRALDYLRTKIAREEPPRKNVHPHAFWTAALSASLVRIHLWEKDVETAWLAAQDQRLPSDLWLELAAARAKTHPADAIPLYLREAESHISRTGKEAYRTAVTLLKKIRDLHLRLSQSAEWTALLNRLRTTHKAKRTFIALVSDL
ncbi:hypothetical protein OpiT1DRAFT_01062 [Opitutaceae bacterium TAV1]|nr:hypothetical protein OpiT1DRAFT_01062 [Opitutaceae bacterium TAV1]